MNNDVTIKVLKWSFAKFIFSILMFFFILPLVANHSRHVDFGYYALVTSCLIFILCSVLYGCEFLGNLLSFSSKKDDE